MSHVATVQIEIKSLEDLEAACKSLGLEFVRDQKTYKNFFTGMDEESARGLCRDLEISPDEVMPAGFDFSEVGQCVHAIRVADEIARRDTPYQIGVVPRRDGRPGYQLLFDVFNAVNGGKGLDHFIGHSGNRLSQAYATQAARRTMIAQGYRAQETRLPNGTIKLQFTR